jgi:cbb3-type cytochrome oxidase subunit 1
MFDWISDTIMAIVTYVPALIVDRDSPSFELIRAMFGMILIAVVVYVIAMKPYRGLVQGLGRKVSAVMKRRR